MGTSIVAPTALYKWALGAVNLVPVPGSKAYVIRILSGQRQPAGRRRADWRNFPRAPEQYFGAAMDLAKSIAARYLKFPDRGYQ